MRLQARIERELPPLAWYLSYAPADAGILLSHGPAVEAGPRGFVEGAWDGSFEGLGFGEAVTFTGSGGRLDGDDTLLLATPTHTLEALYSVESDGRLWAANSLPLLLTRAGLSLDLAYRHYVIDQKSVARGLTRYATTIPTAEGPAVRRHVHANLLLGPTSGLKPLEKPSPPHFADFSTYRDWLTERMARLFENAADPARSVAYRPIATISTGYDSPACAALARGLGCDEAVTIRDASWGKGSSDSGAEIAAALGMRVHEAGLNAYRELPGLPEPEFVAPGDGSDVPLAAFAARLPGRVLITGYHGDKVWDPDNPVVSADIVRGDASGSNLQEFRLRVGFLHLPVPFMGCAHARDIRRISRSREMDPWRVGGLYDRPVPRRLAEEAGVPRELFGQRKLATAVWWDARPPKRESAESYRNYRRTHGVGRGRAARRIHALLYRCHRLWERLEGLLRKLGRRLGVRVELPKIVPARYREPADQDLLVQWGCSILARRYAARTGLRAVADSPD